MNPEAGFLKRECSARDGQRRGCGGGSRHSRAPADRSAPAKPWRATVPPRAQSFLG